MKRFSNKIAKFMVLTLLTTSISGPAFADSANEVCRNLQISQLSQTTNDCLTKAKGTYFDRRTVELLNELVYRGISTEVINAMDASANKTYTETEIKFCFDFVYSGHSTAVVNCLDKLGRSYPTASSTILSTSDRDAIGQALVTLSRAQAAVTDETLKLQIQSSIKELVTILTTKAR